MQTGVPSAARRFASSRTASVSDGSVSSRPTPPPSADPALRPPEIAKAPPHPPTPNAAPCVQFFWFRAWFGQSVAKTMVLQSSGDPVLDRTWPAHGQNPGFCVGPRLCSGQGVASTWPKPSLLHGSRAPFWTERGQNHGFCTGPGPCLGQDVPEPWYLHGSRAPSWPERGQNIAKTHGFCMVPGPRPGQNVAKTVFLQGLAPGRI